ncbi:ThiJ/PfpI family [Legionella lansingensis]|uniref:ThiJ/PfpI family protein n=1 Tax=Legionella lansingensis TaxID=45067 RepID=A0A0W0VXL5_9GAMM|nr:DJ-1/PfpI family protein [Legionella lansingensis]KTD24944.1 ThiJ/PfpI family protein [Legionella lansingensis]SNV50246.1 ThiJ/PfpI family [Legionella lansingensis]
MQTTNVNKKLGVLLYPRVQPMDVIGPWEVFATWKNILGGALEMYLVAETSELIHGVNNIELKPHCDFSNSPQFDFLLIPGGPGRREQVLNKKVIHFISQQAAHCEYILSVCTGVFLLRAANLLQDKQVTTYWRAINELKSTGDVEVIEERMVKSGKIWTAGGVSSGIDLALAFIDEIAGSNTAGKVQLLFEYFPNNKIYCRKNMTSELPPYIPHTQESHEELPDYVKKIIEKEP